MMKNSEILWPLAYPDSDGMMAGYDWRKLRELINGHTINEHDCTGDAGLGIRSGQISLENRDKFTPQKLNTKKYPYKNVEDEISRAQGNGGTGGFFGLPPIEVEDLTATSVSSTQLRHSAQAVPQPTSQVVAANGGR